MTSPLSHISQRKREHLANLARALADAASELASGIEKGDDRSDVEALIYAVKVSLVGPTLDGELAEALRDEVDRRKQAPSAPAPHTTN